MNGLSRRLTCPLCGFELLLYQLSDRAFPLCPCCFASTEATRRGGEPQPEVQGAETDEGGAGAGARTGAAAGAEGGDQASAASAAAAAAAPLLSSRKCPHPARARPRVVCSLQSVWFDL